MRSRHSILALGAFVYACAGDPDPHDGHEHEGTPPPAEQVVTSRDGLRAEMRRLWTEHAVWTRFYLIDAIGGLPATAETTNRLLRNQTDIGDAIKPFYGDAAGEQLTGLLRAHITGAAELVAAAKAGDAARVDTAKQAWTANADQIAAFLAGANPAWPEAHMKSMMREHLDKTLAEATARLQANWDADVRAYDEVIAQMLSMADMLTDGIAQQFPAKVSAQQRTAAHEGLHVAMRALWQDHASWTRVFIVSTAAGLPDNQAAAERLLQNQTDIGDAIKPLYGDAAGAQLTNLLKEHITGAAEVLAAAKANDQARLARARDAWQANGERIAAFLAGANPAWPEADLKGMMVAHLAQTLTEASALLTGDYAASVTAYDAVEAHLMMMADALTAGIVQQFPDRFRPATGG